MLRDESPNLNPAANVPNTVMDVHVAGIPVPSYNSAGVRGGYRGPCPPVHGRLQDFFPEVTRPEGLRWSGGGGLWTGSKACLQQTGYKESKLEKYILT